MLIQTSDAVQNTILSSVEKIKEIARCLIVVIGRAGDKLYLIEFGIESLFLHCSLVLGLFPHIWLQHAEEERKRKAKSKKDILYIYQDLIHSSGCVQPQDDKNLNLREKSDIL